MFRHTRLVAKRPELNVDLGAGTRPDYYALRNYVGRSNVWVMTDATRGLHRTNDPPVLILIGLADGPKHGHALLKDIEDFAGVHLGPGALYGAITRLEERGLITPIETGDRRRPYQLTGAGAAALADKLGELARVTKVGSARLRAAGVQA